MLYRSLARSLVASDAGCRTTRENEGFESREEELFSQIVNSKNSSSSRKKKNKKLTKETTERVAAAARGLFFFLDSFTHSLVRLLGYLV